MSRNNSQKAFYKLLEVSDFSSYSVDEVLTYLAQLIDLSSDLSKQEGLDKAFQIINSLNKNNMRSDQKAILYYFTSNAWGNTFHIKSAFNKTNDWIQEEINQEIYFLRMAINEEGFSTLNPQQMCNIYTNLGNAFDIGGRNLEAIEFWENAINIDHQFGLALGNLGVGLKYSANLLYDKGHQCIYLHKAREYLLSAISKIRGTKIYNPAILSFENSLDWINEKIGKPCGYSCLEKKTPLGRSNKEKLYRKWCLENRLFLNPINDLGVNSFASRDVLLTPDMVTPLDMGPRYQGFYNQIKQEYISARYFCYEGITSTRPHFSDREVWLYDTLDYPCYSLAIEKVKVAYRIAYSLFDKIAYFINEYFNIEKDPNHVYFKSIWFENKQKTKISPKFQITNNPLLRGLYLLSKDLYDLDIDFQYSIEPDAKDINQIRNHLEHKYLKVHEFLITNNEMNNGYMVDDLAFSIERKNLEKKTIKLLRLVRNALIYLSLAINYEERERNMSESKKGFAMPIFCSLIDFKFKK